MMPDSKAVNLHRRSFFALVSFIGRRVFKTQKYLLKSVFPKQNEFLDWKIVPKEFRSKGRSEYYEKAAQAYRTLRYAMKSQDAYEEEARFWGLEMRAKERELSWDRSGWLPKLLSLLYAASSRYGNSIGRPLAMWLLILVCFAGLYAVFRIGFTFEGTWQYLKLLEFSFLQTVRPFGVWSDEGSRAVIRLVFDGELFKVPSGQILFVRMLATMQSVLSLACLALFGFALRRQFRMA